MTSLGFIIAAVVFVLLTVFLFYNYPKKWRKNKAFVIVLLAIRTVGLLGVVSVFAFHRMIPSEAIRKIATIVGTCYYVITILEAMLCLIRNISVRALRCIAKGLKDHWFLDRRVHSVAFLLIAVLILVAGFINIDRLKMTRYEVSIDPPSLEKELTICLIADIHSGSGTWDKTYDEMARLIDESEADVLLIAGDVFDETTKESDVQKLADMMGKIKKPKYGIYYIYGNHDEWLEDLAAERMREMGVTVLEDEMIVLGEDIQLIGCLDPNCGAAKIDELCKECSPDKDKPLLVLTHRPKHFREMADLGVDLVMAGHTHGFNFPQFMAANLFNDMYSGIREYDDMTAVTTSGISAWGYHYKWPAKSEVVTIHVTFDGGEG